MSRLELDSPGFGSGVQAGCHLLPAGPGLGVGGEPPAPVGGIAGGLQGLDSLVKGKRGALFVELVRVDLDPIVELSQLLVGFSEARGGGAGVLVWVLLLEE